MSNSASASAKPQTYYERVANSGLRVKPPFPTLAECNSGELRNLVLPPPPVSSGSPDGIGGGGGGGSSTQPPPTPGPSAAAAVGNGNTSGENGLVECESVKSERVAGSRSGTRVPEPCPYCTQVYKSVLSHMSGAHPVIPPELLFEPWDGPAKDELVRCPADTCGHTIRRDSVPHHCVLRHPGFIEGPSCPQWLSQLAGTISAQPTRKKRKRAESSSSSSGDADGSSACERVPVPPTKKRAIAEKKQQQQSLGMRTDESGTGEVPPVTVHDEVHGGEDAPSTEVRKAEGAQVQRGKNPRKARAPKAPAVHVSPQDAGAPSSGGSRVWTPKVVGVSSTQGNAAVAVRKKRAPSRKREVDSVSAEGQGASSVAGARDGNSEHTVSGSFPGIAAVPCFPSAELDVGAGLTETAGSRFEFALVSTLIQMAAEKRQGWIVVPHAFAQSLSAPEMSVILQHLEDAGMKKPRMSANGAFQLILQWDRAFTISRP